ncbi:protein Wnt-2 [Uranotaenia lowii]|uniref:protein Wnt-2 n=1 Tax=Uranotaenia lowii TaxID=190385 RepID=UPI002479AE49|nr:protein Wnt-2 [Uranotaenia lowii]XP_055591803.1 protein Wnt-2 [Uranotaenia lowii]XP_055591804.1 protein Wnt-2 [Uranotaenia lowii]XP_055591805.1 protein Wnt-2 [Uranotaenia lowii]XP_055591807.1 protein Wnt-2 [Uranotaenia lowii]XP_055591808.1 protein Wnt-2 [Uranotaenia lowii]XP_055591809.1 protein Wnt-2 [Uranotaenia lowii]XP_055591810.1 protein Wnt-2 [Uranotaenia lowii]
MKPFALIVSMVLMFMEARKTESFSPSVLCSRIPGLSPYQRQLCVDAPDAVVSLSAGQHLGAQECQKQFKDHRWNCTQVWQRDMFGHIVIVGSREAAFTYGITSAGAVHAITAACAKGNITMCGCDSRQKMQFSTETDNWKWGGCSADIGFGMRFAKKFLDAREIENDDRSLMNLHNNRVGRKIVKLLLRTECKCHGVSGSCAMKTCWKSLPPFHAIGDIMMKKYRKAKLVQAVALQPGAGPEPSTEATMTTATTTTTISSSPKAKGMTMMVMTMVGSSSSSQQQHLVLKRKAKQQYTSLNSQKPKRMELVYLQPSPNYCERDAISGILGTVGRQCNRTSSSMDKCDLLCCGRGYNTHQIVRSWQCNCKFKWCCTVNCDICTERSEEYTCK